MDVQGFAKAMEKLIMDKYLREEMGRNGIEYVKKHFEVNSNFDKVLTLYKNILDKK
jgi:glycosyltransferase involved in cell wall biosynthesis